MKIKEGFVMRSVAGEHVVVAIGAASILLNGIIKLNDTGAFLWNILACGAEESALAKALQERYGVTAEQAEEDVKAFLEALNGVGCLE